MIELPETKPLEWMGSTRLTVLGFPKRVRQVVGQALYAAQLGDKHQDAKPLKGFERDYRNNYGTHKDR